MIVKNPVGKRIKVEYFDQDENFAKCLPRTGIIKSQVRISNNKKNWFSVYLDEPIDYQIKLSESHNYKLLHCREILISSRWEDYEIGSNKSTSVSILLPINDNWQNSHKNFYDFSDFKLIAWGMCSNIA